MPKTTIDDLALMVQKGFSEVNERFEHVDDRLQHVGTRLDRQEAVIESLRGDVRTLSHKVETIHEDLGALTTLVTEQGGTLSRLTRRVDHVEERVTTLEKHAGL